MPEAFTAIRTVASIITSSSICIGMFSDVIKLLRICLKVGPTCLDCVSGTIVLFSPTTEYIRSLNYDPHRLNTVIVPHSHKHEIDLNSVAKEFASENENIHIFI